MFQLYNGDCLDIMKQIPDGSIDLVLTDPPYGTTACKWDSIIPLEPMWAELKRIVKPNAAIVMTASQPFTTKLISSNIKYFKYTWAWDKGNASNFFQAKYAPLNHLEDVCVFSGGGCNNGSKKPMKYYPQDLVSINKTRTNNNTGGMVGINKGCGSLQGKEYISRFQGYPKTYIKHKVESKGFHPTQKPVSLMEYMIKTYSNEGETVLDFTMGSGTTGVACANTNRKFIGIELDEHYFNVAKQRIEEAHKVAA